MPAADSLKPSNAPLTPTGVAEVAGETFAASDPMSHWHETLSDGSRVLIRPIRKEDANLERVFIERLSPQSRWYRFLGQIKVTNDMLKRLTDIDYRSEVAFVALRHDAGEKKEIGVCRFCIGEDGSSCECAVVVADEWQDRGLGHLLMRLLIDVARRRGIKHMFSVDSAGNQQMSDLAASLGFTRKLNHDSPGEVIYNLDL
jgi:N-acetylglutamate synthase-like GNAT family acetyltransferase